MNKWKSKRNLSLDDLDSRYVENKHIEKIEFYAFRGIVLRVHYTRVSFLDAKG